MEKWKNGFEKRMMPCFYFLISSIDIKIDLIPPNPVFQHSIIPIPHGIRLQHSPMSLTWPRGLSFHWILLLSSFSRYILPLAGLRYHLSILHNDTPA
jgi:hypothetical protein